MLVIDIFYLVDFVDTLLYKLKLNFTIRLTAGRLSICKFIKFIFNNHLPYECDNNYWTTEIVFFTGAKFLITILSKLNLQRQKYHNQLPFGKTETDCARARRCVIKFPCYQLSWITFYPITPNPNRLEIGPHFQRNGYLLDPN